MVVAYLTGTGRVDHAIPTRSGAAGDPLSRLAGLATATINNTGGDIVFARMTPGFVGLTQVNLRAPSMAPGTYPLVISGNGEKSNAAIITVK